MIEEGGIEFSRSGFADGRCLLRLQFQVEEVMNDVIVVSVERRLLNSFFSVFGWFPIDDFQTMFRLRLYEKVSSYAIIR